MVLIGGLRRALTEPAAIVYRSVRLPESDGDRPYKVTIQRIANRSSGTPHLLVSFETSAAGQQPVQDAAPIEMDQVSREQLRTLEAELTHTKENLQSAIEELETSNEELQASNEELQASNEELQSTNEELQSVNEELYTVNAEYQRKIAELTELTNDMDNLLSSTEVGTIFLDRQLRIRKFTPQIAETFTLVPHDVGRSIETFTNRLDHPELVEDLKRVLASGQPVERELRDVAGKSFFLRILAYRAKGTIDGVVITLIDVSGLKAAEDALFHERYLLEQPARNRSRRDLLQGRARPVHSRQPRDGDEARSQVAGRRWSGKTALELPEQSAAMELHKQDEAVLAHGRGPALQAREASGGRTRAVASGIW